MPKLPTDYSQTIIYKIVCNDLTINDVYVGHTTNFIKRKSYHKYHSLDDNLKLYKNIRDNGGWSCFSMIELEKYKCVDANEARARERYWYEVLNANLNSKKPLISEYEIIEYNKEYQKEYWVKNKNKLKTYKDIYMKENKEKKKEYDKIYREKNQEKIKKRREANNDEINKKQRQKRLEKKLELNSK